MDIQVKKRKIKNEYIVIVVMVFLFVFVSFLSLSSIKKLHGNARVINYVGIVRGATQKLVKEELLGHPNDALIARLDSIVTELYTDEQTDQHDLIVLPDRDFLNHMRQVQEYWSRLKNQIQDIRQKEDTMPLYDLSQDYFSLVNDTVFSAERYSEKVLRRSLISLIAAIGCFFLLIIISMACFLRSLRIQRKLAALNAIAYIDPLTGIENRASCERLINKLKTYPPEKDIVVIMFDMNNLKLTNDFFGHKGGDKIIKDFAQFLKSEVRESDFVGRYGGDEFLAIFQNANDAAAESYLSRLNSRIVARNSICVNELEKISYAAGHVLGSLGKTTMEDLINQADKNMYARKLQMKRKD
ncbi:putative signaling protein [Treponema primitia ZAS-2]|uniref:diguanylate cyclase n=1 Tax=Treponema primitia (strain ATCC BAA-887 / DSM 12427 / ZAS-2) TaxID=545694 RepID=F5YMD9_TREPZ|nr:GGDEF domain-containing protein [Treponema primitia]AEF83800.1 putative signaling protein [Treponema primitia ZAS-2]